MKLIDMKCPYCGAPIQVRATDRTARCEYCRSTFAVESEPPVTPYRPTYVPPSTPGKTQKKAITAIIVWILAFFVLFPAAIFGIIAFNSVNDAVGTAQAAPHTYRETPESSPVQRFVRLVFHKNLSEITPEEYASIRYLSITDTDDNARIWQFEYALEVDEEGNPADKKTVSFVDANDAEYRDLECFPGLVVLDCGNCYDLSRSDSSDWSLGNMTELRYYSGSFNESPSRLSRRFADAGQIEYLQLHCYSASELTELAAFTGLKTLYLDYVSDDITDLSPLVQLTSLQTLMLNLSGDTVRDISCLSEAKNLTGLGIGGPVTGYAFLKDMPQLTSLQISNTTGLKELGFLSSLPSLTDLTLYDTALKDIDALRGCTSLTSLSLVDNENIRDYSPLSELTGLETLTLYSEYKEDVSSLAQCTNLKEAYVNGEAFPALSGLTGLETLSVRLWTSVDCSLLAGMNSLTSLTFTGYGSVYHMEALQSLPALTSFSIGNNAPMYYDTPQKEQSRAGATVLFQLPALRELTIKNVSTGSEYIYIDSAAVQDNPTLQSLSVSNNTDWVFDDSNTAVPLGSASDSFLRRFTGLQSLNAAGTEITDLSFTEAMPQLQELYLEDNYIQDISPLQALPELQIVDLTNNPLAAGSTLTHGYLIADG